MYPKCVKLETQSIKENADKSSKPVAGSSFVIWRTVAAAVDCACPRHASD